MTISHIAFRPACDAIAHQSEPALIHCGIPVLNPASVQDYLDLGLMGFAM